MGKLVNKHYTDENITKEMVNKLLPYFNKDIILINIGTDKCIYDCLSPMIGTFLKQNNFSFPIYGTIKEPIHALNLEKRLNEIHIKYPNAFIIGIDACVGSEEQIGNILLRDIPISPGKGVGKTLPKVGDISIVGITKDNEELDFFNTNNVRLNFIMDMANIIKDILIETERQYYINKQEIAVC